MSRVRHLFVYGTLRSSGGFPIQQVVPDATIPLGPGEMPGRLYDLGPYPAMLPAREPGDRVIGEVHELIEARAEELLRVLDAYEGVDRRHPRAGLYRREVGRGWAEQGWKGLVWWYCYNGQVIDAQRITSGDYFLR